MTAATILVIDDQDWELLAIQRLLAKVNDLDVNMISASSVAEAAYFQLADADLALIDVGCLWRRGEPEADAGERLATLRSAGLACRIIGISSVLPDHLLCSLERLGLHSVLTKDQLSPGLLSRLLTEAAGTSGQGNSPNQA